MPEETKDQWFSKLAKVARKLVPADRGIERTYAQLKQFQEACQDAVAGAMGGQSLLETEIQTNSENAIKWELRARVAVEVDNETLAIDCLRRKATFTQSSKEYEARLPLMRQRRLHLHGRFESVNTIVYRLLILKELFAALPQQSTLRDDLIAVIKAFVEELPSFSKESESPEPSFSKAVVIAEQRISKLEQQVAAFAVSFKRENLDWATEFDETASMLRASTQEAISKIEEHLETQRAIETQRENEKNEDAAWEARQLIWSDEKALESLHTSLQSLQKILLMQV